MLKNGSFSKLCCPKYQRNMSRRKQNLVLVFEENDDERIIDSKLVRLWMNCFIIGEEYQNEVNGIFRLEGHKTNEIRGFDVTENQRRIIKEIIVRLNLKSIKFIFLLFKYFNYNKHFNYKYNSVLNSIILGKVVILFLKFNLPK